MSKIPKDLLYTQDHEWIKIEGNIAIVGITDYAQNQLGDVVFVDVESEGDELEQGDEFGTVESVKSASELYMPVSGKVLEWNTALDDTPETLNEDPYDAGWIIKIEGSFSTDHLLSPDEYAALVESES